MENLKVLPRQWTHEEIEEELHNVSRIIVDCEPSKLPESMQKLLKAFIKPKKKQIQVVSSKLFMYDVMKACSENKIKAYASMY
jgi:hypothetical protein